MPKEWVVTPPHPDARRLGDQLRVSRLTAQVLLNRGVTDADAGRQFFRPQLADLHPPERIWGLPAAADGLARAIRERRRIALYGDYDVDGITGVAILWHCLRLAGLEAQCYVPHRLEEGYGLNAAAIEKLAADGAEVIVTVDCGVTALEPAEAARRCGAALFITDHHAPRRGPDGRPLLPEAAGIVHPGLGDGPVNPDLSGAGVALKLAWGVAQRLCGGERVSEAYRNFLVHATGLAALGLIADVVPLTGENRILAHYGLRGLPASPYAGVQALIGSAGLTGQALNGYAVGFRLGPRLNAIGRMGHARLAVELLTRAGAEESKRIAEVLESQNRQRQALERRILGEARQMAVERGLDGDGSRAIVLAADGWHAGVVGIVAARLVEEFGRPTVLVALDNGVGQGSGRSVRHFPLDEALHACREHLLSYGGHAMAAGLRVERGRVAAFAEAFGRQAAQRLTPADLLPRLRIDAMSELEELQDGLVDELERLEPHGMGNPAPVFATDWLDVCGAPRAVGSGGDHLQVSLGRGGLQRKGIAFGLAKYRDRLADARRCRAAFRPIRNEWNGRRTVEMQIVDFQFSDA